MTPQIYKSTLFIIFIIIFVLTAAITLLGVLGVLAIEKNYLNTLFATLIVELVGAVIALFRSAKFFEDDPASAPPAPKPAEKPAVLEATREFFVGRWRVEQVVANLSGGTVLDYRPDGRFVGASESFLGAEGRKEKISGAWDIKKMSAEKFLLTVRFDDGRPEFQGTFKIFDQNHIQNVDENYVAARVTD